MYVVGLYVLYSHLQLPVVLSSSQQVCCLRQCSWGSSRCVPVRSFSCHGSSQQAANFHEPSSSHHWTSPRPSKCRVVSSLVDVEVNRLPYNLRSKICSCQQIIALYNHCRTKRLKKWRILAGDGLSTRPTTATYM